MTAVWAQRAIVAALVLAAIAYVAWRAWRAAAAVARRGGARGRGCGPDCGC